MPRPGSSLLPRPSWVSRRPVLGVTSPSSFHRRAGQLLAPRQSLTSGRLGSVFLPDLPHWRGDVGSGRLSTSSSHSNFGSLDESGVSSLVPYRPAAVVERCPTAVGLETSGGG